MLCASLTGLFPKGDEPTSLPLGQVIPLKKDVKMMREIRPPSFTESGSNEVI